MSIKVLLTVISLTLISACTTLQDASNAEGTGVVSTYDGTYDAVWNATVKVLEESKLDIVNQDKGDGKILAQKGMSAFSYGENVAVFVDKKSEGATEVEVVSKKSMAHNISAKNWSNYIHTNIAQQLK